MAACGMVALLPGRDPAAQQKAAQGPLAGLPSAPGPHVSRLQALKDGEWINLGAPAADPRWGSGRGRSWSSKMPYAPHLQGAFLNGQGVHGYIKSDGYFMDEIFFYDLNAHRWICLYPGTDTRNFVENIKKGNLQVNEDGQLVDKEGQPVPFSAIPGHGYQTHAYDTDLHLYVFANGPGIGNEQHVKDQPWCKEGTGLLLQQGKTDRVIGTPYYFNTGNGKFERFPVNGPRMQGSGAGGVLSYLPSKRALWFYGAGVTQMAETATRRWVPSGAKGPTPKGIDFGACFDSKRDRIYVAGGSYRDPWGKDEGYVFIYDAKTNAWSNPPNKGRPPGNFASNYACMHYDAVADRVVVVLYAAEKNARGLYVYDPETAAWSDASLPLPAGFLERECGHGFYSPEVNAHFFYSAGDSDDRGVMWAYRYKNQRN
jgi:Kelch motif protein